MERRFVIYRVVVCEWVSHLLMYLRDSLTRYLDALIYSHFRLTKLPQNTAPPMMKTLSSSLLTHWMILFALCVNAALLVLAGATA